MRPRKPTLEQMLDVELGDTLFPRAFIQYIFRGGLIVYYRKESWKWIEIIILMGNQLKEGFMSCFFVVTLLFLAFWHKVKSNLFSLVIIVSMFIGMQLVMFMHILKGQNIHL